MPEQIREARLPLVVLLLLLQCLMLPALSQAASRILMADSTPRILLNPRITSELDISSYLDVLSDPASRLTIADVQADIPAFVPVNDRGITTAPGDNTFWIRGSISRSVDDASPAGNWLLLLENSHVRNAQLYVKTRDGMVAVSALPDQRFVVFPLALSSDSALHFYVRMQVDGMFSIPVKVWQRDAWVLSQRSLLTVWGLLLGAIAALALYNLFIYMSLHERAYLQLSLFLQSTLVLILARDGFLTRYFHLLPDWLGTRFELCMELLTLVLAVMFTRSYLSTARFYPMIDLSLRFTRVFCVVLLLVALAGVLPSGLAYGGFILCSLLFAVPAVLASMHAADRATRYYIAGWSVFFVGYVIYQLSHTGLLPVNDFTQRGKDLALCFLGLSLSLGLAEQIQRERFEKQRALQRQQETMLELKYSEEQIQKKVLRDTLQEFPAWQALGVALQEAIGRSAQSGESVVVVMMDLHHINRVEEQLGHAARNELLTRATKRLSVILRSVSGVLPLNETASDYVPMAVLEDGSYGFILRGMSDITINHAIEEVEQAMSRPFFYQGLALQPGISFGLARLLEHGDDAEHLLQHAQRSLQADKRKNLEKECDLDSVDQYNARNIVLINDLRSAIHEDQISLYFQPVYNLQRQEVCGVEVFTRWDSLTGERISPAEIFQLAEIGGFVAELTLRVIEKALRYFVVAVNVQQTTLKLSVNLSPKCLREDHFLDEVSLLLTRYHLPPQRLSLEIKEAAIIEDPSITREVLNRIRNLGIGLTIDELGAAYSNPSYLSSLPVTEVKLDQRFVSQLQEYDCRVMVQMLISLCREQHIKLVVHGVEDESTLLQLEQMGCTFAQGHYLATPILAREFKLPRQLSGRLQFQPV